MVVKPKLTFCIEKFFQNKDESVNGKTSINQKGAMNKTIDPIKAF